MSDLSTLIEQVTRFDDAFEQALQGLKEIDVAEASVQLARKLSVAVPIADRAGVRASQIKEDEQADQSEQVLANIIEFQWLPMVRDTLILLRDTVLQHFKAEVQHLDELATESDLRLLLGASLKKLDLAFSDLKGFTSKRLESIQSSKDKGNRQMRRWASQRSPSSVYHEQLGQLADQASKLEQLRHKIAYKHKALTEIRNSILGAAEQARQMVTEYQITAQETIDFIEGMAEVDAKKIAAHLKDVVETLPLADQKIPFTTTLEKSLNKLEEAVEIPFINKNGQVVSKKINFKAGTQLWLESEIMPLLYELWSLQNNLGTATKVSALNIKNRALVMANLDSSRESFDANKEFTLPFKSFLTNSELRLKEIKSIQRTLRRRLEKRFWIHKIFDEETLFLNSPFQRSFRPIGLQQNPWLENIQAWFRKQFNQVKNLQSLLEREDQLSEQEKIVRFIRGREVAEVNPDYLSLFRTRDFIGESFCVGRRQELQRAEEVIDQWKWGIAGSLLLSGQRLAGKSLMGELIAHRFFPRSTIRPKPNANLLWEGRSFTSTQNLIDLLQFIDKHPPERPTLLWLDDLELWSDHEVQLSRSLEGCIRFLQNPISAQLMVMVSMSNWLINQFDDIYQIRRTFHTEINVDRMQASEIKEAIAIRHGATHKMLLGEDGQELASSEFSKITSRIYRSSEGNIGEALNRWTAGIHRIDDDHVTYRQPADVQLPNFIDADSAILLSTILMHKRTNEYRLRKLFGPRFGEKYQQILQRLLNLKVLQRNPQGMLVINEFIVNDISRHLAEARFITNKQQYLQQL